MPSSSITLANTINWASTFNFGRSFTVNFNEPALTSANIVMQTMLGPPFSWKWNRNEVGWFSTPGVQDYFLINWSGNLPITSPSTYVIDSNGNSQFASTIGATGITLPAFNNTFNGTTTDGTVVWTNVGKLYSTLGLNPTWSLYWIETSSVFDPGQSKWFEMQTKNRLGLDASQGRPKFISAQSTDGFGNVGFRLLPVPDVSYQIAVNTQVKPPLFINTSQTWSPIPDEYSHIYNWGFLAMMFLFSDDYRFGYANQRFISTLLSVSEGLTETEINIFLNNWQNITGQPIEKFNKIQQGSQSRGISG